MEVLLRLIGETPLPTIREVIVWEDRQLQVIAQTTAVAIALRGRVVTDPQRLHPALQLHHQHVTAVQTAHIAAVEVSVAAIAVEVAFPVATEVTADAVKTYRMLK